MKKVLLIIGILLLFVIAALAGYYVWSMDALSTEENIQTFVIEPGTTKTEIAKDLEEAGLIRSQYGLLVYLFFNGGNIQAGEYELSANMTPVEMLNKFTTGDVKINTVTLTFVEGQKVMDYAKVVADNLNISEDEFINQMADQTYLESLISEYWFLSDAILNPELYYPLEGYLFPDTYEFLETATVTDVIHTLLDNTERKIEPIREQIEANEHSFHEILTMASIVEKEANTDSDRATVAQVFWTRLRDNWSLGSDVTAYYGDHKEMGVDELTWEVLYDKNPYNTRLTDGSMNGKLPIGPICSPSLSSITATLNPSATNYYFFVANVCTGEVFFQNTNAEFSNKVKELQQVCAQN